MGLPTLKENASRNPSPTPVGNDTKLVPKPPSEKEKVNRRTLNKRHSFLMGMNVEILGDGILQKDVFEKITEILISVKETATAQKIFSNFPDFETGKVSRGDFEGGVNKLDRHICTTISINDWGRLCDHFQCEDDGDSSVSSQKFADYCFAINDIGWKAEKTRLNHNNNVITHNHLTREQEESEDPKLDEIMVDTGETLQNSLVGAGDSDPSTLKSEQNLDLSASHLQPLPQSDSQSQLETPMEDHSATATLVHTVSKLFWKQAQTVEMHFYTNDKNGLNIFSIVTYNCSQQSIYDTIHLNLNKLQLATKAKLVKSENCAPEDFISRTLPHIKMVDYVLARVALKDGQFTLVRLSEDPDDISELSKGVQLPKNYVVGREITRNAPVVFTEFNKSMQNLQREAEKAAKITKQAQKQQQIVKISLEAFGGGGGGRRKIDQSWPIAKRRWKVAMNRVLLENTYSYYCERVKQMTWNKI